MARATLPETRASGRRTHAPHAPCRLDLCCLLLSGCCKLIGTSSQPASPLARSLALHSWMAGGVPVEQNLRLRCTLQRTVPYIYTHYTAHYNACYATMYIDQLVLLLVYASMCAYRRSVRTFLQGGGVIHTGAALPPHAQGCCASEAGSMNLLQYSTLHYYYCAARAPQWAAAGDRRSAHSPARSAVV